MSEIKGKVIAITGASSGIGEAAPACSLKEARQSSWARGARTGSKRWYQPSAPKAARRSGDIAHDRERLEVQRSSLGPSSWPK